MTGRFIRCDETLAPKIQKFGWMYSGGQGSWSGLFPLKALLVEGDNEAAAVIVRMGDLKRTQLPGL